MIELRTKLQRAVRDLALQVAAAKAAIEKRRALMLAKDPFELSPGTSQLDRRIR